MNLLRLINDEGEIVREWESERPWRQEWAMRGEVGFSIFHGLCAGQRTQVIPPDHLTIELTLAEAVPA